MGNYIAEEKSFPCIATIVNCLNILGKWEGIMSPSTLHGKDVLNWADLLWVITAVESSREQWSFQYQRTAFQYNFFARLEANLKQGTEGNIHMIIKLYQLAVLLLRCSYITTEQHRNVILLIATI